MLQCHPINAQPFARVNLKDGTGVFSADALPGSESWTVACPGGVAPCPGIGGGDPPDEFTPLQSGEYSITYSKGLTGGGSDSCTYPLIVGGPGLRVELQWEHDLGGNGVDLDLHRPSDTAPWSLTGASQDCSHANCTAAAFSLPESPEAPDWFDGTAPPDPVDWSDPNSPYNTCYHAPGGRGAEWEAIGLGCHDPRLDLSNVACDPTQSDPHGHDFCGPENANIDVPPLGQWARLAVHYYAAHGLSYAVHPRVKVFCDGALAADLGPSGYHLPQTPIVFTAGDGAGPPDDNLFWLVGDVALNQACGRRRCTVVPLHAEGGARAPVLSTGAAAEAGFGPAYPGP